MRFFWLKMIGMRQRNLTPFIGPRDARINFRRHALRHRQICNWIRVVTWTRYSTKQAEQDARKLALPGLKAKAQQLLTIFQPDPWQHPPPYEKLVGDLSGAYSKITTIQHRLVYQILEAQKAVKILRLWTHHELLVLKLICFPIIRWLGDDRCWY